MAREERNTIGYTVALISEFAHHFGIFPDTIDALAQVCKNNGGELK